jgi:hypothetical protein
MPACHHQANLLSRACLIEKQSLNRQGIPASTTRGGRFIILAAKGTHHVMPVPDQVRDDISGIQNTLELMDSGFRQDDKIRTRSTFYDLI